jgi:hypothetical protein
MTTKTGEAVYQELCDKIGADKVRNECGCPDVQETQPCDPP